MYTNSARCAAHPNSSCLWNTLPAPGQCLNATTITDCTSLTNNNCNFTLPNGTECAPQGLWCRNVQCIDLTGPTETTQTTCESWAPSGSCRWLYSSPLSQEEGVCAFTANLPCTAYLNAAQCNEDTVSDNGEGCLWVKNSTESTSTTLADGHCETKSAARMCGVYYGQTECVTDLSGLCFYNTIGSVSRCLNQSSITTCSVLSTANCITPYTDGLDCVPDGEGGCRMIMCTDLSSNKTSCESTGCSWFYTAADIQTDSDGLCVPFIAPNQMLCSNYLNAAQCNGDTGAQSSGCLWVKASPTSATLAEGYCAVKTGFKNCWAYYTNQNCSADVSGWCFWNVLGGGTDGQCLNRTQTPSCGVLSAANCIPQYFNQHSCVLDSGVCRQSTCIDVVGTTAEKKTTCESSAHSETCLWVYSVFNATTTGSCVASISLLCEWYANIEQCNADTTHEGGGCIWVRNSSSTSTNLLSDGHCEAKAAPKQCGVYYNQTSCSGSGVNNQCFWNIIGDLGTCLNRSEITSCTVLSSENCTPLYGISCIADGTGGCRQTVCADITGSSAMSRDKCQNSQHTTDCIWLFSGIISEVDGTCVSSTPPGFVCASYVNAAQCNADVTTTTQQQQQSGESGCLWVKNSAESTSSAVADGHCEAKSGDIECGYYFESSCATTTDQTTAGLCFWNSVGNSAKCLNQSQITSCSLLGTSNCNSVHSNGLSCVVDGAYCRQSLCADIAGQSSANKTLCEAPLHTSPCVWLYNDTNSEDFGTCIPSLTLSCSEYANLAQCNSDQDLQCVWVHPANDSQDPGWCYSFVSLVCSFYEHTEQCNNDTGLGCMWLYTSVDTQTEGSCVSSLGLTCPHYINRAQCLNDSAHGCTFINKNGEFVCESLSSVTDCEWLIDGDTCGRNTEHGLAYCVWGDGKCGATSRCESRKLADECEADTDCKWIWNIQNNGGTCIPSETLTCTQYLSESQCDADTTTSRSGCVWIVENVQSSCVSLSSLTNADCSLVTDSSKCLTLGACNWVSSSSGSKAPSALTRFLSSSSSSFPFSPSSLFIASQSTSALSALVYTATIANTNTDPDVSGVCKFDCARLRGAQDCGAYASVCSYNNGICSFLDTINCSSAKNEYDCKSGLCQYTAGSCRHYPCQTYGDDICISIDECDYYMKASVRCGDFVKGADNACEATLGQKACQINTNCVWNASDGCTAAEKSNNDPEEEVQPSADKTKSNGTTTTIIIVVVVVVVVVIVTVIVIIVVVMQQRRKNPRGGGGVGGGGRNNKGEMAIFGEYAKTKKNLSNSSSADALGPVQRTGSDAVGSVDEEEGEDEVEVEEEIEEEVED